MGSKSTTTTRTIYGNTTTQNPYAYAKTNNSGTVAGFQNGTALNSIYNFVNNSIDSLLNDYMNPNLNSVTNRAKLNSFANTLSTQTRTNMENNIVNPLSKRNMIRSSQAQDLYKNLSNQNISAIANYANDLISSSQNDSAKMLANLLSYYMQGANYLSDMQSHSLSASSGNATQTKNASNESASNAVAEILPIVIAAISAMA